MDTLSCTGCKDMIMATDTETLSRIIDKCTSCKRCYIEESQQAKTLPDLFEEQDFNFNVLGDSKNRLYRAQFVESCNEYYVSWKSERVGEDGNTAKTYCPEDVENFLENKIYFRI